MNLKTECLAKTPLSAEAVAAIYGMLEKFAEPGQRQIVKNLCLSHERLRAELEGAEALLVKQGVWTDDRGQPLR
jgi:hypothetical protein